MKVELDASAFFFPYLTVGVVLCGLTAIVVLGSMLVLTGSMGPGRGGRVPKRQLFIAMLFAVILAIAGGTCLEYNARLIRERCVSPTK